MFLFRKYDHVLICPASICVTLCDSQLLYLQGHSQHAGEQKDLPSDKIAIRRFNDALQNSKKRSASTAKLSTD